MNAAGSVDCPPTTNHVDVSLPTGQATTTSSSVHSSRWNSRKTNDQQHRRREAAAAAAQELASLLQVAVQRQRTLADARVGVDGRWRHVGARVADHPDGHFALVGSAGRRCSPTANRRRCSRRPRRRRGSGPCRADRRCPARAPSWRAADPSGWCSSTSVVRSRTPSAPRRRRPRGCRRPSSTRRDPRSPASGRRRRPAARWGSRRRENTANRVNIAAIHTVAKANTFTHTSPGSTNAANPLSSTDRRAARRADVDRAPQHDRPWRRRSQHCGERRQPLHRRGGDEAAGEPRVSHQTLQTTNSTAAATTVHSAAEDHTGMQRIQVRQAARLVHGRTGEHLELRRVHRRTQRRARRCGTIRRGGLPAAAHTAGTARQASSESDPPPELGECCSVVGVG